MVQDARTPEGNPGESERRKTSVYRESPPRPEVLAAIGQETRGASPGPVVQKAVAAGTLLEGLAGTCAAVLAILALAGTYPLILSAVGIIVLGAAFLFSAGGIAAVVGRFRRKLRWGPAVAGGAGLEALAAAAAVAGGILALAGVVPMTMLPVSTIVLGACCLFAAGGFRVLETGGTDGGVISGDSPGSEVEILVGLGTAVLGILALIGFDVLRFTEIAILTLGSGVLAKCMAYSARLGARM